MWCNSYGGHTLLHLAVRHGNIEAVRLLFKNGADVNAFDARWNSPLSVVFLLPNPNTEIILTLVHHGADTECRDRQGLTPLMRACQQGHRELMEILLKAKANLYALDHHSANLLHFMTPERRGTQTTNSYVEMFSIVAGNHVNPHHRNSHGCSPTQATICDNRFLTLLLNGPFRIDETDPFPWHIVPFIHCSWLGARLRLLRRKISHERLYQILNTEPRKGWSPLCRMASLGTIEVIKNLLSMGACLEYEGCPYGTALMAAVQAGRLESVMFLVRRGAAISYQLLHKQQSALHSRTPERIR